MKILITGGAGYLSQGLTIPFEEKGHQLRLMDVRPFESRHEVVVGNVAQFNDVKKAVQGMDAMVITHMAPRVNGADYPEPSPAFDINVTGTANLFVAGIQANIKRFVIVSSFAAISDQPSQKRTFGLKSKGIYGMTKVCQEVVAEQFQREHQLSVAVIRVGYIMSEKTLTDKYGRKITHRSPRLTDPRDIGEVARLAVELPDLKYDVFHVISAEEGLEECDVNYTCKRLNWKPQFTFSHLPKKEPVAQA
jgi:nucleoside-diphosphate-sugar epimerase